MLRDHDFAIKAADFPRKQLSELNQLGSHLARPRLSQPKTKFNLVKINKRKLPLDFFPRDPSSRRQSHERPYFPTETTLPIRLQKKSESQRKHHSPERTSFFGSQQEPGSKLATSGGNRLLSRKFQTREEPKRGLYALQQSRKLNTAAKNHKPDILQLFPSDYDPQLQLLLASSKTQQLRSPNLNPINAKLHSGGCLEDPEGEVQGCLQPLQREPRAKKPANLDNVWFQEKGEILNITFYNAKSSCFPPISRGNTKPL